MALHIGIVGCSAEGAALCYRTICEKGAQLLGPHAHPEITMHTHSLANYVERIGRGDWESVAELMLDSASKLERAGADFLICPDNTIHQAMGFVQSRSTLQWLHIAEIVALEAAQRRYRRVGLLGTRWLVESNIYPEKFAEHAIFCLLPTQDERIEIDRIIMNELVYGIFRPESVTYHQLVIRRMKDEACEAAVLGCTEIPLIISNRNSPLPVLDSTRLLAWAALRRAVASDAVSSRPDINSERL